MTTLRSFITRPVTLALAGALACAVPVSLMAPAAAQTSAETRKLDRAVAALRAITTMKADFTQTDRQGRVISGELTLKNPGKIRFEYGDDANFLIISNGRSLDMVDYDVRQVERWPISNSPLGALLNPNRNVRQYGTLIPTDNRAVTSIEVADPDRPEFGRIRLIFLDNARAPGGMELVSWVALDSQNHRTSIRLMNHRYGVNVPDSTFRYRDPRQTTRRPG